MSKKIIKGLIFISLIILIEVFISTCELPPMNTTSHMVSESSKESIERGFFVKRINMDELEGDIVKESWVEYCWMNYSTKPRTRQIENCKQLLIAFNKNEYLDGYLKNWDLECDKGGFGRNTNVLSLEWDDSLSEFEIRKRVYKQNWKRENAEKNTFAIVR